ncbi:MAG: hypothetical protein ACPG49_08310 [Chitinophagales bacterium]
MKALFYQFGGICFLFSFWMGCNNKQSKVMEKTEDVKAVEYTETIVIGHGGGITGATTQYIIKGDGQLTKTYGMPTGKMDTTLLSKLSTEKLKQVHEGLDSLKLKEISFNSPGNMSWFIAIEAGDSLQNKITWGQPAKQKVDETIKNYHNTILKWVQEMENEKQ